MNSANGDFFLDPTLLLLRQSAEDFTEMPSQFTVQRPAAALRNKQYGIFALALAVAYGYHARPSRNSLSCAWRLTVGSFVD